MFIFIIKYFSLTQFCQKLSTLYSNIGYSHYYSHVDKWHYIIFPTSPQLLVFIRFMTCEFTSSLFKAN